MSEVEPSKKGARCKLCSVEYKTDHEVNDINEMPDDVFCHFLAYHLDLIQAMAFGNFEFGVDLD